MILEAVEATRETGGGDCRFTARIDAPSAEAALGSLLTVIGQTSGHAVLAEEGSLRRVVIEREEPIHREDASSNPSSGVGTRIGDIGARHPNLPGRPGRS